MHCDCGLSSTDFWNGGLILERDWPFERPRISRPIRPRQKVPGKNMKKILKYCLHFFGDLKFDYWVHGISRKMILREVQQGFSSFLAKFFSHISFCFQSRVLRNFEKSVHIVKIMHEIQLALYPFFG